MAKFSLADWAAKVSGALDIDKAALEAEAQQIARDYPDAAVQVAKLEAYLQSVSPAAILEQFAGAVHGFASDYAAGVAKIDPGAWQGAG